MSALNTDLLLAAGTIEGPYRRPHPLVLSCPMRVLRALRRIALRILTGGQR